MGRRPDRPRPPGPPAMPTYRRGSTRRGPSAQSSAAVRTRPGAGARPTAAAGTPSSALAGTGPSEGRGQRAEQDPQVEPQRPVADVERIPRFLAGHVGHRSLTHLPHAAETGPHLVTKGAKLCGELGEVVVREWPRTHQAHVTLDDVPELR